MKGFPCDSAGKESSCNAGDLGLIPGLGRTPGEWKGYPLQYYGLENSMDCIVQGVVKSQTQLTEWISHTQIYIWKGRTRALFKNNAINKKYNLFKVLQIVILKFYTQPKKKKGKKCHFQTNKAKKKKGVTSKYAL